MSAYISIPRDLTKVKTKVFLNLTKRQIICFGLAVLAGVPMFFLLKSISPNISFATFGMLVICLPFFLFAMFERNGQHLEVILRNIIKAKFLRPKVRPYKTNNYYALLEKQQKLNEEVRKIVVQSKENKRKTPEKRDQAAAGLKRKGTEKNKGACGGSKGK